MKFKVPSIYEINLNLKGGKWLESVIGRGRGGVMIYFRITLGTTVLLLPDLSVPEGTSKSVLSSRYSTHDCNMYDLSNPVS